MLAALHRVLNDESGATAIEYAFVASLISVVIAGVVGTIGGSVSTSFANIASGM